MKFFSRLAIAIAMVLAAGAARAQVVGPIQFTEPEFPLGTTVNGLTVSTLNGVPIASLSFSFSFGGSPSADCTVSGGPGTSTYVSDPSIEGAPGILSITLGVDADDFRFGFAALPGGGEEPALVDGGPALRAWSRPTRLRTLGATGVSALAIPGAVQLRAYTAGGALVGTANVDALDNPGDDFPGNLAAVTTATPFRRVEIEWNEEAVSRFALDNLAVRQAAAASTVVPSLSGLGLAALATAIAAAAIALLRLRA